MKNKPFFLYGAWIVSLTATLGSLYFSEIRKFIPCELCWYQRIMMYPLVLILGIATFQGDFRVKKYVLPMAAIGGFISLMHYLEQKVPGFSGIKPCVTGVPCSGQYINWLGFITIPFLALIAFILIIICMCMIKGEKE
ncbi:2-oxoglutarate dehydrogenase [Bacillus glycinifermentans]|uniref:Probable disulfide formation protein n=1 Tax=Bacillus glycinifermentans TaxID=1664069 RepID=A0A0J6EUS5_9BACI|nr:disulfide oxidoreductase [Bacillus glycinifermentans]ATH93127.1 disulfide bond formation protein B [Bacillus glycinifermentans]KMM56194.1 2-oxoglutarate dehydrogenase [Bacillus glycinifermentans]KRT94371.1 2-oxoglutarate dehydrogenase [Bacillus glycinifermentans]MEC0485904.1 disulfide oxidoreductase [Bacillus glycinifermentans]MEC0496717.1 disulfide oxidoreductase [Bacillus glycinifermentans]